MAAPDLVGLGTTAFAARCFPSDHSWVRLTSAPRDACQAQMSGTASPLGTVVTLVVGAVGDAGNVVHAASVVGDVESVLGAVDAVGDAVSVVGAEDAAGGTVDAACAIGSVVAVVVVVVVVVDQQ